MDEDADSSEATAADKDRLVEQKKVVKKKKKRAEGGTAAVEKRERVTSRTSSRDIAEPQQLRRPRGGA